MLFVLLFSVNFALTIQTVKLMETKEPLFSLQRK